MDETTVGIAARDRCQAVNRASSSETIAIASTSAGIAAPR